MAAYDVSLSLLCPQETPSVDSGRLLLAHEYALSILAISADPISTAL